jgi:hypothetical protein
MSLTDISLDAQVEALHDGVTKEVAEHDSKPIGGLQLSALLAQSSQEIVVKHDVHRVEEHVNSGPNCQFEQTPGLGSAALGLLLF